MEHVNTKKTYLNSGTLLNNGKYRIIRFIGSGGFGCTYEGLHILLKKRVAIKEFFVKDFCNRDTTSHSVSVATEGKKALVEKLRGKFIEEARSLCSLNHQGIVHVSDVFEENDTAYFVMDYIDGHSLSQILNESGHISEKRAVRYIMQVADALRYVHSKNRMHLDIKPDNIMIDSNDNAILIDFGTSKQYDEVNGENTSTLIGRTPGYAPIEQMGNNVMRFTPATDIYALGATLYKLITGKTPISATLVASGERQMPLPTNISEKVRKAVTAAMRIRKSDRPQTIDEFIGLLTGKRDNNIKIVTVIDGKDKDTDKIKHIKSTYERKITPNADKSENNKKAAGGSKKILVTIAIALACIVVLCGGYYLFYNITANMKISSDKIYTYDTNDSYNTTSEETTSATNSNESQDRTDNPNDIQTKPSGSEGLYGFASERLLTESDVAGMTSDELKIMRNEIFARHGYIFKTKPMKDYFSAQPWYKGMYDDVSSMLSDIEIENVRFIKQHE